jgi:hypothetical protein
MHDRRADLTDQDADHPPQVAPLRDQIGGRIVRVTADGAYDGAPTDQTIAAHGDGTGGRILPRSTAIPSCELGPPTERNRHLKMILEQRRPDWQIATDYCQRALIETTMGRHKMLIGPRLRAHGFASQQTEAAIGVAVLNECWWPDAGLGPSPTDQRIVAGSWGHLALSTASTNALFHHNPVLSDRRVWQGATAHYANPDSRGGSRHTVRRVAPISGEHPV